MTDGGVAQLVERLNGIQDVRGSTPLISTIIYISRLADIDASKEGADDTKRLKGNSAVKPF